MAGGLFQLMGECNMEEQLCLEEWLACLCLEQEACQVPPAFYRVCWHTFLESADQPTAATHAALRVLRVACRVKPEVVDRHVLERLLALLKKYLEVRPDFVIVREMTLILAQKHADQECEGLVRPFLMGFIYLLTERLEEPDSHWHMAAEQVVNTIFAVVRFPEKYSMMFLNQASARLMALQQGGPISESPLARCLFLVGHVALRLTGEIEAIEHRLRDCKQEKEESEMDQVVGGAEAEREKKIEHLHRLQEGLLRKPAFRKWLPLVRHLVQEVTEHSKGSSSELERAAALTMTKFMCISHEYCVEMMDPLFRMLASRGVDSCIKNNLVVSLGDLLHRFPNEVEPYNRQLYRNLLDECPKVRRCALMVITHLFLNDMIKLKSEFLNVALLFEDPEPDIQALAALFFKEVYKKDPKYILNTLPEALVRLSDLSPQSGLPIH
jgi:condensin complex subunit 1